MKQVVTGTLATLDLLRAITALTVLIVHFPFAPAGLVLAPKGYLAVDLFFILSGFVIAQAYEDRLRSRAWFRSFCIVLPILIIGWIIARLFNTPVRTWLNRRFTPHKPMPAAETAP